MISGQSFQSKRKLERELDKLLDEVWFTRVESLAETVLYIFENKGRTQLSNLEILSQSIRRYNDVIAYAMRQTGKDHRRKGEWAKKTKNNMLFGEYFVKFLEDLKKDVDKIVPSEEDKNWARLYALRICMRNLNSAYRFKLAVKK